MSMIIENKDHLLQIVERVPVGKSMDISTGPAFHLNASCLRTRSNSWRLSVHSKTPVTFTPDTANNIVPFLPLRLATYESGYWAEYDPLVKVEDEQVDVILLQSLLEQNSLLVERGLDEMWDAIWKLGGQVSPDSPLLLKGSVHGYQLTSPFATQVVDVVEGENGTRMMAPFREDTQATVLIVNTDEVWFLCCGETFGPLKKGKEHDLRD